MDRGADGTGPRRSAGTLGMFHHYLGLDCRCLLSCLRNTLCRQYTTPLAQYVTCQMGAKLLEYQIIWGI